MKKILLLTFLGPALLFAQNDSTETPKKFIKVISIAVYGGGDFYRDGYEDRTIFQQAVPGSPMMFADLSGYGNQENYFNYIGINANSSTGIMVSTRLRCQKKYSELRFGLSHSVNTISSLYYSKGSTTNVGSSTLPGGEVLYTDSVYQSSYRYEWYTETMNLHVAWIVKSDPGKILNCYTGFSLNGGIGYNGVISASRFDYSYLSNYSNGQSHLYYTSQQRVEYENSERYRAPLVMQMGGYIPIGVNLRLGKRHSFFSHLTIFSEYQGGVSVIASPGITSKIRTYSNMYGGLRYYVRAPKYVKKHNREGNRRRRGYSHGEEHLQH